YGAVVAVPAVGHSLAGGRFYAKRRGSLSIAHAGQRTRCMGGLCLLNIGIFACAREAQQRFLLIARGLSGQGVLPSLTLREPGGWTCMY
ncbi:hypothetical protein, partial [Pseudomonas chlororaphis]|uniref:hypothetical protein n=1 Tax=Pseudomonas chlororaphis TaxID=587753 RepID=UPI001C83B8BC